MVRGTIPFKCTECDHVFVAPDMEYAATVFSVPQPCPECRSVRTMPISFFGFAFRIIYKKIWQTLKDLQKHPKEEL